MRKNIPTFKLPIIGLMLILFSQVGSIQAASFYVDQQNPIASDTNPGSKNQPWRTLYPTTQATFSAGDTIIVRAGVYTRRAGGTVEPIISPRTSGRRNAPITFIASPPHSAVLDGLGTGKSVIEILSHNYIVIDGFKITNAGSAAIVVNGSAQRAVYGIKIKNNLINGVQNKFAAADTDGIRLNNVAQSRISNNKINDIHDGALTENAAAIKLYNVDRIMIENNDLTNITSGIFVRSNGYNITIKRNFIINSEYGIKVSNKNKTSLRQIVVTNNIFKNVELAVQLGNEGGETDKVIVANNIFANYSVGALQVAQSGIKKIEIWNNIFERGSSGSPFIADVFTYDDPPKSITTMDYNLFTRRPVFINGLLSSNHRLYTLRDWNTYTKHDQHSLVGSAKFVNIKRNNFLLKEASVGISGGRSNGRVSGKKVNLGAYDSNASRIGFQRSHKNKTGLQTASSKVQSKGAAVKKPRAAKKTRKPKKSAQRVARITAEKTQKPKPPVSPRVKKTEKPKPTKSDWKKRYNKQRHDVVASVSAYSGPKPGKKTGLRKFGWDVRTARNFDGVCILESSRIDFYDGHDNTGLKLRLLRDKLFLVTQSNIDISFKDIGVQVGSNKLVPAESVVDAQSVVFKKNLPKLLSQLRKNRTARIQLRFWPTYPATKTYSEKIVLDGFNQAYLDYTACKQEN